MEEKKDKIDKRILLGSLLIGLGGLFFLKSLNVFDFNFTRIFFSWPFFFIVIGSYIFINTSRKLFGAILAGLGFIFILPRIFPAIDYNNSVIFAIILIAVGIYVIVNQRKKSETDGDKFGQISTDVIDDVAIFGGGTKIITSENFKGGNITAIFGGSEIILRGCKLAEGTNVIDVLAVFGGTTIIVPSDWNIVLNVTPVFGGFSNKSVKDPNRVIDTSKTLIIKGLVVFGGGELKTYF
ncbi:MAG: LiaF-related protein [Ignavibacteriaceae bacterium]|jgi:predicted membrane protein|nr:LiaF-related protein [Ignavibacteriaceae bacterium]